MRLIANKPCSFGGRQFYIGDEIPVNLVADARMQEKMGVITIANDTERVSGGESVTLFTQEQVDKMIAEAVDEAVNNTISEMEQKQKALQEELQQQAVATELMVAEPTAYQDIIQIAVKCESDDKNGQYMMIMAKPEEIQQVFSIMQLNTDEGIRAITDIKDEHVLILLHAADSRKTIKDAAKKQASKLFSTEKVSNESSKGNEITGANTEGADT